VIVAQRFFWNVAEPDLSDLGVVSEYGETLDVVGEAQVLLKQCAPREFLNGSIPIRKRLERGFAKRQWRKEEPKVPDLLAHWGVSAMDWQKGRLGVEIQVTANTSRMLNDFRRIEIACEKELIAVGVELTLMLETANLCTDRIAFFEDGVKYVQRFEKARCIVLGLMQDGFGDRPLPKQRTRQGRRQRLIQPDFDAE
jgi:hypothetical protein